MVRNDCQSMALLKTAGQSYACIMRSVEEAQLQQFDHCMGRPVEEAYFRSITTPYRTTFPMGTVTLQLSVISIQIT